MCRSEINTGVALMNYNLNTNQKVAIVLALTVVAVGTWFFFNILQMFLFPNPLLILPLIIYSILIFVYLPTRIILYFYYRSYEDRGFRPSVSIVVPAYNEGKQIRKTLLSLIRSDYSDKQIIVVEDGSTDDTYFHISRIQAKNPGKIEVIRFPENRGKRAAMAEGVAHSRGDIVVFIDSDTSVDNDAIKYLVAPFDDPDVGGVTGKVKVQNRNTNLLTRMLGVRYVMSFDFYRCTRSAYGGVMCLSGVISAYRKDILKKIMPRWLEQRFLGKKCTFGDDRSLTNNVIIEGYKTVYSRNAVAMTIVPETLPKLLKMLARWNRSFIRESYILFKYLVKKENLVRKKMMMFDFALTSLISLFIIFVVSFMFFRIATDPVLILKFIGSISIMAGIYMTFYVRVERDWHFIFGILYSFFYMAVLIWMLPYAMLTIKKNTWGTR
jgi:hyaluronan synthase